MAIATSRIIRRPHRLGVEACISGTNINVWGLVWHRRLGLSDAKILGSIQGLKPENLEAAWEYAETHKDEIDEAIRRNEES